MQGPFYDKNVGSWYMENPVTKERKWKNTPTGLEVTTPDGTTIRTGVPRAGATAGGMQKPTAAMIEKHMFNANEAEARIAPIMDNFEDSYQELFPRIGFEWTALKEKFGADVPDDTKAELKKFTTFRSDTIENVNKYIKDITGAQMSEAEASRLRLAVPDTGEGVWPKQSASQFRAQVEKARRNIKLAKARYKYALRNGLIKVDADGQAGEAQMKRLEKSTPLSSMKTIMTNRAAALRKDLGARGVKGEAADNLIRKTIATEFGFN